MRGIGVWGLFMIRQGTGRRFIVRILLRMLTKMVSKDKQTLGLSVLKVSNFIDQAKNSKISVSTRNYFFILSSKSRYTNTIAQTEVQLC